MADRWVGETISLRDVQGLIDPDTGKIDTDLVNVTALAQYVGTGDQTAMLASGAGLLDWFVRSDLSNQMWACVTLPSTVLGNWTPAASLSNATPAALGVAAVGVSTLAARGDHVHAMPSAADVGADPAGSASTVAGNLTSHLNDTADAHLSTAIGYTPTTGTDWTDPDPTTVGGALDTAIARVKALEGGTGNAISFNGRTGAVSPASGDYAASQITSTPAGNLAATDVQAAINELDSEKQPLDATLTALAGMTTGAGDLLFFTGADTPAPAKISEQTEASTAASTDWLLLETAAGNVRRVQVGNIAGLAGSGATVTGTGALVYTVATADVAMAATTGAALDCTTDALVATLPTSPSASMVAGVMRYAGTTCRSYVRPASTGKIIAAQQLISLGTQGETVQFQWIDSTLGWAMSRGAAIGLTCPIPSGTQFLMLPNATWTQSGGLVSSVKDHSGNAYNATEGTNKPTYSATGINSGPALDFDGVNDVLAASSAILNTTGAWFLAFTFIADDVTTIQAIVSKQDLSGSIENSMTVQLNAGALYAYTIDEAASAASIGKQSSALSIGTKYTVVVTYDGGSNATTSLLMYLNNVAQATTSNSGVFASVTSAAGAFRLGHRISSGGAAERFYNGKLNWCIAGTGVPTAAEISAWYTFGNSL